MLLSPLLRAPRATARWRFKKNPHVRADNVYETGVYDSKFGSAYEMLPYYRERREEDKDKGAVGEDEECGRTEDKAHKRQDSVMCDALTWEWWLLGSFERVFSGVQTSECLRCWGCKKLCSMALLFGRLCT
jgi:hypothetical protein